MLPLLLSNYYFASIPGDGGMIEGSGSSGGDGVFKVADFAHNNYAII